MGAAEVRMFVRENARVGIGDILEKEGRKVEEEEEEEINEAGGEAFFVRLDVTSEADWTAAISVTVERFGKLDVLVNNAGVSAHSMLEDTSVEQWDRVMDINSKGVFLGTRAAIPEMRKAGGGSIVNISSQLGIVGAEYSSPQYQASKGAVRLLTKSAAIQYAEDGIRVNSVHPGPVVTAMSEARRADPVEYPLSLSRIPMGRYAEPDEIAYGVLYLASDESSYLTGSELVIDGGWTAQ